MAFKVGREEGSLVMYGDEMRPQYVGQQAGGAILEGGRPGVAS